MSRWRNLLCLILCQLLLGPCFEWGSCRCFAQDAAEFASRCDSMLDSIKSIRYTVRYSRTPESSTKWRTTFVAMAGDSARITMRAEFRSDPGLVLLDDFLILDGVRKSLHTPNEALLGVFSREALANNEMSICPAGNWREFESLVPLLGIRFGSAGDGFYKLSELVDRCPACELEQEATLAGAKGSLIRMDLTTQLANLAASRFKLEVLLSPDHGWLPVASRTEWENEPGVTWTTVSRTRKIFSGSEGVWFPVEVETVTEGPTAQYTTIESVEGLEINGNIHPEDFVLTFPAYSVVTYLTEARSYPGTQNLEKAEFLGADGAVEKSFDSAETLEQFLVERLEGATPKSEKSGPAGESMPPVPADSQDSRASGAFRPRAPAVIAGILALLGVTLLWHLGKSGKNKKS